MAVVSVSSLNIGTSRYTHYTRTRKQATRLPSQLTQFDAAADSTWIEADWERKTPTGRKLKSAVNKL